MSLEILVTSDFICPWCLVGERRLAEAIKTLPEGVEVAIRWRPFELNPTMPAEGADRRVYRTMKFGSWERSMMLDAQTVEAAHGDAIAFNYAAIEKTPNTLLAHRLMLIAERNGVASFVADAILSAYFEQGRDIGDAVTLTEIAAEQGLDRAEIAAFLASDGGVAEIRAIQSDQKAATIRSVPLFEIDGERISGAQSVATLATALQRAVEHGGVPPVAALGVS